MTRIESSHTILVGKQSPKRSVPIFKRVRLTIATYRAKPSAEGKGTPTLRQGWLWAKAEALFRRAA